MTATQSEISGSSRGTEGRDQRGRKGAYLTDRQIGKAAAYGRKVTCKFLATQPAHEVEGYVVGMDDYHWMVASVTPETLRKEGDEPITLMLVHKSRVDVTVLHGDSTIAREDEAAQTALTSVGSAFWRYCENHYNGR